MRCTNKITAVVIVFAFFFYVQKAMAQKTITIDAASQVATIKDLLGVNKGPGGRLAGYKDAGISIVRTHDFHGACDYEYYTDFWNYNSDTEEYSINAAFECDNPDHYHWAESDAKLDTFVVNNMDIYFRIGVSYPDNPKYRTPPLAPPIDDDNLNFTKFGEICKRTIMHFNQGWDNGKQYNIRYFEIWNEPGGLFWKGSPIQFNRMYQTACDSIKSVMPEAKVGALGAVPTTTLGVDEEYREGFFSFLQHHEVPLDFYSWHLYSAKNPYGLKMWADTIRNTLDEFGLTNAESHISEINDELGEGLQALNESPKGTAYYLSNMITAQKSPIDKLFWYVGIGFFNPDDGITPDYKYSGYALKIFHLLKSETPLQIQSDGDEVIDNEWQTDTTNLMVLSGISEDEDKVYIAISNYDSEHENFDITINNLPWTDNDQIDITKNIVDDQNKFTESTTTESGNSTMTVSVDNMPSPSVILLRLEKTIGTSISKNNKTLDSHKIRIAPNPVGKNMPIRIRNDENQPIRKISVYTIDGRLVFNRNIKSAQKKEIVLANHGLKSGTYIVEIMGDKNKVSRKISVY